MPEAKAGENARIICTDDQGVEWHLTEDSQVGDWLASRKKTARCWPTRSHPLIDRAATQRRQLAAAASVVKGLSLGNC